MRHEHESEQDLTHETVPKGLAAPQTGQPVRFVAARRVNFLKSRVRPTLASRHFGVGGVGEANLNLCASEVPGHFSICAHLGPIYYANSRPRSDVDSQTREAYSFEITSRRAQTRVDGRSVSLRLSPGAHLRPAVVQIDNQWPLQRPQRRWFKGSGSSSEENQFDRAGLASGHGAQRALGATTTTTAIVAAPATN